MLKRELDETIRIAREAGRILMKVYATEFGVAYKGATDPVTDADTQANAYIVGELARLFPEDGIVAEETENTGSAAGKARCWYVDPLDGTKEFIAKNGEFSVMIGLAIDGRAVLGVVYQPEHDKLYAGVVTDDATGAPDATSHAFLVDKGERRALRVSEIGAPSELKLVVSRSHRDPTTDALVRTLGITHERPSGSVGLKVGLIAEREADLYIHPSNRSSRWDACAPDAILRAAGGVFLDLAGERYHYDGVTIPNARGIFACNTAATPGVLEAARTAGRAAGLPC